MRLRNPVGPTEISGTATARLGVALLSCASDPAVSVSIDGKTVVAPTVVRSDGSLQEIRIDTTDFEPMSNAVEIVTQGEPSRYPARHSSITVWGVVYQGQNIDLDKGQYSLPGSALIDDDTVAVLNTPGKVIVPAPVLPHLDP